MEIIFTYLSVEEEKTKAWVMFAVYWLVFTLFTFVVHKILTSYYLRFTNYTKNDWDDRLADQTNKPIRFLLLTLSATAAVKLSTLPMKDFESLEIVLKGFTIFFLFWTAERIVYALIQAGVLLKTVNRSSRTLVSIIVRAGIFVLAGLMVLDSAGISITPILASLGVGSIAVALALQDTLSNLFSGFYLLVDKPFQAGDFVELEGGTQGYVQKVGWRSTHVLQMTNNVIVVPNSKVASATIINYDLSDSHSGMKVACGVSYDSDLEKVERVCIEVAKNLMSSNDLVVKDFTPVVRYSEFGDSSINFNVILRVNKYDNHFELKHQFIKALHKRFNEEGIEIPFPQRVLTLKNPVKAEMIKGAQL